MIRTFRAAGKAAAVLGLAASITLGGPFSGEGSAFPAVATPVPVALSLEAQVATSVGAETADAEQDCLASAVYFEARGEPIQGQLAVADVVMNRAASGRYPATICGVVTQRWQFSFVNRTGRIPAADRGSEAWRKAVAIARIAQAGTARAVAQNVLWYHAEYVSPSWGRRLARQDKIGLHIFYS
jgi:spore germination cell wall hydrolase CwlJ-like protein